jgi:hypothetical protein
MADLQDEGNGNTEITGSCMFDPNFKLKRQAPAGYDFGSNREASLFYNIFFA